MPDANVRVICRFRPANDRERRENVEAKQADGMNLDIVDQRTVHVTTASKENLTFTFDHVFGEGATQKQVYEVTANETVKDILDGYNGTIFAYGQTGAGKTFTMTSNLTATNGVGMETRGIIPRACAQLFQHIEQDSSATEYTIKCSFLEIYKEQIRDLLDPKSNTKLRIRETPAKGVWVEGLTEAFVASEADIVGLLLAGEQARSVASTNMNAVSSRSHTLFVITLVQKAKDGSTKTSRLNLADLAGSEKVGKTGASGETLEEAKKINQSLSALGNCIVALTKSAEKRKHVPYRDSKLTFILRESLGGNSKTSLLIACSPHLYNLEETVSTLRFGQRAKSIKNSVKINAHKSVQELELIVSKLQSEVSRLHLYSKLLEIELNTRCPGEVDLASIQEKVLKTLKENPNVLAQSDKPNKSAASTYVPLIHSNTYISTNSNHSTSGGNNASQTPVNGLQQNLAVPTPSKKIRSSSSSSNDIQSNTNNTTPTVSGTPTPKARTRSGSLQTSTSNGNLSIPSGSGLQDSSSSSLSTTLSGISTPPIDWSSDGGLISPPSEESDFDSWAPMNLVEAQLAYDRMKEELEFKVQDLTEELVQARDESGVASYKEKLEKEFEAMKAAHETKLVDANKIAADLASQVAWAAEQAEDLGNQLEKSEIHVQQLEQDKAQLQAKVSSLEQLVQTESSSSKIMLEEKDRDTEKLVSTLKGEQEIQMAAKEEANQRNQAELKSKLHISQSQFEESQSHLMKAKNEIESLTSENSDLKLQVQQLENTCKDQSSKSSVDLQQKQQEVDQSHAKISELETKQAQLESQLAQMKSEMDTNQEIFNSTLEGMKSRLEVKENTLNGALQDRDKLSAEIQSLKDSSQAEHILLNATISSKINDLEEAKRSLSNSKEENLKSKHQIETISLQLEACQSEVSTVKKENSTLASLLEDSKSKHAFTSSVLQARDSRVAELETALDQSSKEASQLAIQLKLAQQSEKSLEQRLQELAIRMEDQRRQNDEGLKLIVEMNLSLTNKNQMLQNDLNSVNSQLSDTLVKLSATQASFDALKMLRAEEIAKFAELEKELNDFKKEMIQVKSELSSTKTELKYTKSESMQAKADLEQAKVELETSKTHLSTSKEVLEASKLESRTQIQKLEMNAKDLEKTIVEEQKNTLNAQLSASKSKTDAEMARTETLTIQTKLQVELDKRQFEMNELQKEIEKLNISMKQNETESTEAKKRNLEALQSKDVEHQIHVKQLNDSHKQREAKLELDLKEVKRSLLNVREELVTTQQKLQEALGISNDIPQTSTLQIGGHQSNQLNLKTAHPSSSHSSTSAQQIGQHGASVLIRSKISANPSSSIDHFHHHQEAKADWMFVNICLDGSAHSSGWKKLWVSLSDKKAILYENTDMKKVIDTIPLKKAQLYQLPDSIKSIPEQPFNFCFVILLTQSNRQDEYALCSDQQVQIESWAQALINMECEPVAFASLNMESKPIAPAAPAAPATLSAPPATPKAKSSLMANAAATPTPNRSFISGWFG